MRLSEPDGDGEGEMERYEAREIDREAQLGTALAVIWCELHCLHDDISYIKDMMRNVNMEDDGGGDDDGGGGDDVSVCFTHSLSVFSFFLPLLFLFILLHLSDPAFPSTCTP